MAGQIPSPGQLPDPQELSSDATQQNAIDQQSSMNKGSSLVTPTNIQADALYSTDANGTTSIFLVIWIAFYHSVQAQQGQAQVESEQIDNINQIQNGLIQVLSGINYETLPASQVNATTPNMSVITNLNVNNQQIQAVINVQQDTIGQIQQVSQVANSQASTTIQNTTQTISEGNAVAQLSTSIVQSVSGGG